MGARRRTGSAGHRGRAAPAALAALVALLLAGPARAGNAPDSIPSILVSERAAEAAGVHVGDVVDISPDPALARPARMRVAGILPVKADPVDIGRGTLWVKMHFTDYAALAGRPDDADEVVLKARTPAEAQALCDRVNALAPGCRAYTSAELARRSSQTFEVISLFHEAISLITMVAGAAFLLAILLFKVEERRHELGALRLIGIRRRSLLAFLSLEAAGIALAGSVLGIGFGRVVAAGVNAYYQRFYHTTLVFASVTPGVAALALALGIGFGVGAGLLVAARVLHFKPLELLGR